MDETKQLLVLLTLCGLLATVNAQCFNTLTRSCGTFCCPPINSVDQFDTNGFQRTECCTTLSPRTGCCSPQENIVAQCPGGLICPGDSTLDDVGGIRNQCCLYFRMGCCSLVENRDLTIYFQVTIGLVVSLAVVIFITIGLIACYCCCICN